MSRAIFHGGDSGLANFKVMHGVELSFSAKIGGWFGNKSSMLGPGGVNHVCSNGGVDGDTFENHIVDGLLEVVYGMMIGDWSKSRIVSVVGW